ncbi:MAG: sigma-70 family RNA polymerase sigma factor [Cyclobacteriaceae bacterium]|nr:sigma-70 family RNA polymerase sigma factor [Cyclobacteriaceae bacterium HetDA_MAG_MS6]
MKELTDEQLMINLQREKFDDLQHLFDRYQVRLYNYFLKCTLDVEESKDLTQMTFIRVMKYRASFKAGHRFQFWLFQIARNLLKDHFRKLKVYRDQFSPVEHLPEHAEEDTAGLIEQEEKLHQALALLEPDKRELLVMSKFQKMKYEEIAEIRGVSVSAIKVQVHRTIAKLRKIYFEELK